MSEISEALSPFRSLFESHLMDEMEQSGKLMHLDAGTIILEPGSYVKFIPLLVKGSIKVLRQGNDANEILLYYVEPGETCAMSLTCCVSNQKSNVKAIAEEDTTMISLPVNKSDEWMTTYPSWKSFIMQTYRNRFEELLKAIDGIAFQKVDERLHHYLVEKSKLLKSSEIQISHQQIAEELNSSREVISRLLKQLELKGLVSLGRNKISLNLPN
ncbi:MAG: Crp/Fnr family transcriptional regulator [Bacteroidota bacterium]|jgi:CRP/FNR family transcriptional regulator